MKKQKKLNQVPAYELPELLTHLANNHCKYRIGCADVDRGILNIGDVHMRRFESADPDNICKEQFTICTDNSFYVVLSDRIYDDEHREPVMVGDTAQTLHQEIHNLYFAVMSYNANKWERKQSMYRFVFYFFVGALAGTIGSCINNVYQKPKIRELEKENESLRKVIGIYDRQQILNDPRITVVYDSVAKKTK